VDLMNTVIPRYVSPPHKYEMVTAAEIVGSTYLAEDGQRRPQTWPLNLVQNPEQAGQLAAYAMANSREQGPITAYLPHLWKFYKPGDCLRLESARTGISADVIIQQRALSAEMEVVLQIRTETAAKHDFALGKVADPPPTPVAGQTLQERDEVVSGVLEPRRAAHEVINFNPIEWPFTSDDDSITIAAFTGTLDDGRIIEFPADELTGLDAGTRFAMIWHLTDEVYSAVEAPAEAVRADSDYAFIGWHATSDAGVWPAGPTLPGGAGGGGQFYLPTNVEE
jgi:hypothetical protein